MNILTTLGIQSENMGASTGTTWLDTTANRKLTIVSPIDGNNLGSVFEASTDDYQTCVTTAHQAFQSWRLTPPPKRGEIVRQIGDGLREKKELLGRLISMEMGKSLQEGYGEVQEMIDICDFAVGQSRQLYGCTIASERPQHRLYDQYHPLGVVGIISAFNFPVAVWSWNAMLAAVCGDTSIWKPSSKTPLTAISVQHILSTVLKKNNLPEGIFNLVIGSGSIIGKEMAHDPALPLLSITGSTRVGRKSATAVAERLGKCILELGGNNAIILTPQANLKMAIPAIVFSAVGTAGQRCTTTRRIIIHDTIYEKVKSSLLSGYRSLKIGTPLDEGNHMGPLINRQAAEEYLKALELLREQGGNVLCGARILSGDGYESGCYVEPVLAEAENMWPIVQQETFAPILYLIKYSGNVEDAITIQNDVAQGLSSSLFTEQLREAELFLSAAGSDCGIANINIGTSGAEIGGAFGGEKETGGGRESGSDAWKGYMRRQTNTINYGTAVPLAQGIRFEI